MTQPAPKLPWSFTAAALVAVAALYNSAKPSFIGPTIAVLLILPHLTSLRLPGHRIIDWTLRIGIWAVVITMMPRRVSQGASILYEPDYVHLFGWLCGFEMVLRVWTRWNYGPSRVEAFLLTALIFTAASNTLERTVFHALAPLYALLVVICLRQMTHRTEGGSGPPRLLTPKRLVAACFAIGIGFAVVQTVTAFDSKISSWAVQLLRAGRDSRRSEIGWATAPELREVFNPQPSLDRVALIDGPVNERHLRAIAFDQFENGRWMPTLQQRQFTKLDPAAVQGAGEGSQLRVRLVGNTDDILLLPLNAGQLVAEAELEADIGAAIHLGESMDDFEYQLTVSTSEKYQGPLCWPLTDVTRAAYLALPANFDPRITSLSREVAGDGDPGIRVLRIAHHLRSQHQYSLSYSPEGDDALADFILNRRAAHCQYFASALVMMSRAAGIPARMVTGFYAHESYGRDRMVVRGRDSHAWAECWIEGVGWITLDATPAGGFPSQQSTRASSWQRFWERAGDLPGDIRRWLGDLPWKKLLIYGALAAAMVAGIAALIRRRRAARGSDSLAYAPASQALAELAARFERWLKRRGVAIQSNHTWREQIGGRDGACAAFIDQYDRARFGVGDPQSVNGAARLIEQLERESPELQPWTNPPNSPSTTA